MPVDRCVCHSVPFTYLVKRHTEDGLSLEQLSDETNCCTGCGMCEPYLELALLSGQTAIPPMAPDDLDELIRRVKAKRRGSNGPEPS